MNEIGTPYARGRAGAPPRRDGRTPPRMAEPEPSVVPLWVYGFFVCGVALFVALPVLPVRLLLLGLFWVVYLFTLFTAPQRLIFLFLLGPLTMTVAPGLALRLVRGFNALTVFLITLAVVAYLERSREPEALRVNRCFRPVMFYVLLLACSTAHAYLAGSVMKWHWEDMSWSRPGLFQHLIAYKDIVSYVLFLPIAFRLIRGAKALTTALRMFAFVMLVESLQQIVVSAKAVLTGADLTVRAGGLVSGESNVFGGALALGIVVMLPVLADGKPRFADRVLLSAAVVSGTIAMLITLSRGAWLACLGGLLFYGVVRRSKILVMLLLVALTATAWLPTAVLDRVRTTFIESSSVDVSFRQDEADFEASAQRRLEVWQRFPEMFLDAPLFGQGHGAFLYYYYKEYRPRTAMAAHSTPIQLAVEEGIFGLVAYAWLVGTLFLGGWRLMRTSKDPYLHVLGAAFAAGVVCFVIRDLTVTQLDSGPGVLLLWILGGGIVRASVAAQASAPVQPGGFRGRSADQELETA